MLGASTRSAAAGKNDGGNQSMICVVNKCFSTPVVLTLSHAIVMENEKQFRDECDALMCKMLSNDKAGARRGSVRRAPCVSR